MTEGVQQTPRFCGDCGRSLRALLVPHVERPCAACGKSVYLVEQGDDGQGIKVNAGDKFAIPAGWLTFSLDPAQSKGNLTRHGVGWYVTSVLYQEAIVRDPSGIEDLLKQLEEQADHVLEHSELVGHLDLENEADGEQAWEILAKDKSSVEWWALVEGSMVHLLRDSLNEGDAAKATVWALHLQAARTMLIYKRSLEEHLWQGYTHSRTVHRLGLAAAQASEKARLIEALRPAFAALPEDALHVWLEGGVEIRPQLGVPSQLEEQQLRALARFYLDQFDHRRRAKELTAQRKDAAVKNRLEGLTVGVAAVGLLVTILVALGWL